MKLSKLVKFLFLFIVLVLCMGIAMSIGRVGGEAADSANIPLTTMEKDPGQPGQNTDTVVAEEQTKPDSEVKEMPDLPMSDSFSFVKSLMALAFVLGLIFLTAYLFKKIMGINTTGLRSNRVPIQMVGNLPLGDKKFLSVVEIQGKHYFIGISQNSINLLSELELDLSQEDHYGKMGKQGNNFENIFQKARSLLKNQNPIMRMKK